MTLSDRQLISAILFFIFFSACSGTAYSDVYGNSPDFPGWPLNTFPQSSPQETKFIIPATSCRVRKIPIFPDKNTLFLNTVNVLDNFQTEELSCNGGDKTVQVTTAVPILLEEYPFSRFTLRNNKMFGAQLAGQANRTLPKTLYPNQVELNRRQEKIFSILSLAGAGIARDFFSYDTRRFVVEKQKGRYNFSNSDFLTELSRKYNIELIGRLSLHYGDPRKEGKPEDMAAYLEYVKAAVERYDGDENLGCLLRFPDCYSMGDGQNPASSHTKRADWGKKHRIEYWELLKEPAPGRRKRVGNEAGLRAVHAREILQASFSAIRTAAPEAKILFAGMGPVNEPGYTEDGYYEELVSGGGADYFDIAGIDAFTKPAAEKIDQYHQVLQKFRSTKPIWVAQTGVPDRQGHRIRFANGGGNPDAQCIYVAKAFTTAFAAGAEKIFWGDFLDNSKAKGNRRATIWDSTGLFETETWQLKPAYFSYKLMAAALYNFKTLDEISPGVHRFTFADRSPVYVLLPDLL